MYLAVQRISAQRGLTLAGILGMCSAAILVMSIPIYVNAVFTELLQAELSAPLAGERPPFTFVFHRIGNETWPLTWPDVQTADDFLADPTAVNLGLPETTRTRFFKTGRFGLFAPDTVNYASLSARLANVQLGTISDLETHIELVEGRFPLPTNTAPFEVIISQAFAARTGIHPGEGYTAFAGEYRQPVQIPVQIVGVWQATDPEELFWFRDISSFDEVLILSPESFIGPLQSATGGSLSEVLWYYVLDATNVDVDSAPAVADRIRRIRNQVSTLLPNIFLTSPLELLTRFQTESQTLTVQLFAFLIPILALNILFIGLVTGMSVRARQGEIAVLRSRGASRFQIVGLGIVDSLVIAGCSLLLAVPGSLAAAHLATRIPSFLEFSGTTALPISLNATAIWAGIAILGLAILLQSLPVIVVSGHTVITLSRQLARQTEPPWWQWMGLDFLLLIPAGYGTYLMIRQGQVLPTGANSSLPNPFDNPLLLLIPALVSVALTLIVIRALPIVLTGLSRLAALSANVSFLFAVRHLARTPGLYTTPLALLGVTLSLSVFLSATAQTLEVNLIEQALYQAGADIVLFPAVESTTPESDGDSSGIVAGSTGSIPDWFYVPLSDYRQLSGMQQAARVGRFTASVRRTVDSRGILMGVDRSAFAQVAFWKTEFASMSLGELMNQLADAPNSVLLPSDFMQRNAFTVGDSVVVTAQVYGYNLVLNLKVAGNFDRFPTWNPRWGPLFVVNLPDLFEQIGMEVPTAIWFDVAPGVDTGTIRTELGRLNPYGGIQTPFLAGVEKEAERPERRGLMGILTVGFLTAILLASLGFALNVTYSIQRRSVELGILRSIGLTAGQIAGYLAWELSILVLLGVVGGIWLGMLVSNLWIPFFRVGNNDYAQLLPISVQFAWPAIHTIYGLFTVVFIATLLMLISLSRRLRLFEIVKMGENI